METSELVIFQGKNIRRHWDKKQKKWYFSVVDIISILIDQSNFTKARKYWNKLAVRLRKEGSQTVTNCHQLKMKAGDGKMRLTDVADIETLFRLIQSVPSPKAEPIKIWLAKVGTERLQDMGDPERSLNRARDFWQRMGRSEKWIQQRMMSQETRNKLTDYWKTHDVNEQSEYAILTNIIHEEWSDLSVKDHKKLKSLENENLRDHMTEAELIFTTLAEFSTRQIAEKLESTGFEENKLPAHKGGRVAKIARLELEKKTGKSIISGSSYLKENKKIK